MKANDEQEFTSEMRAERTNVDGTLPTTPSIQEASLQVSHDIPTTGSEKCVVIMRDDNGGEDLTVSISNQNDLTSIGKRNDVEASMTLPPILRSSQSIQVRDERKHQVSFSNHEMYEFTTLTALEEQKDLVSPISADDITLGQSGQEQDLFTDKQGVRYHHALVRSRTACAPRSRKQRMSRDVMKFFGLPTRHGMGGGEGNEDEEQLPKRGRFIVSSRDVVDKSSDNKAKAKKQYHLTVKPTTKGPSLQKWVGMAEKVLIYDDRDKGSVEICGLKSSQMVIRYIHWAFRRSFVAVFISGAACYITVTFLFAVAIYGYSRSRPHCIEGVTPDTEDYTGPEGGTFSDAFQLSWTTFATVGFGLVYTDISTDPNSCMGLTIMVALEGFAGSCFASFCGAIIFAKVSRIQSFAQVTFSDPLVLRYGNGVNDDVLDDKDESCGDGEVSDDCIQLLMDCPARIPCPVLEFRINNNLHSTAGGEIMDASVNIVASIDASQACPSLRHVRKLRGRKGKKGARRTCTTVKQRQIQSIEPELQRPDLGSLSCSTSSSLESVFNTIRPGQTLTQEIEEDPSGYLVPKRIFAKLEVETPDHPFFMRMWTVRHTIDEFSPLLRAEARHMVRLNQGYWPRQLNSYAKVKEAIHFDQILVSLSGTSNAAANAVYAQKAYDFVDLCVGYRFVNQMYRDDRDNGWRVDERLIHDITEQAGGGREPLSGDFDDSRDRASVDHIMVL